MGQHASRLRLEAPKRPRQIEDAPPQGRNQQQPQKCPLCLDYLTQPAANTTLPCPWGHKLHTACLNRMRLFDLANASSVSATCPMCRRPIPSQPIPPQQIPPPRDWQIDMTDTRFEMWPPFPQLDDRPPEELTRHIPDDSNPVVVRAIMVLGEIPPENMQFWSDSQLAEAIVRSIFEPRDNRGPLLEQIYDWLGEDRRRPGVIGDNLIHGRDVMSNIPRYHQLDLEYESGILLKTMLSPLTKRVMEHVIEIFHAALPFLDQ